MLCRAFLEVDKRDKRSIKGKPSGLTETNPWLPVGVLPETVKLLHKQAQPLNDLEMDPHF